MVANPERRTHCVRIQPADGDPIRIAIAYPIDLKMSNGEVYMGGIYAQPSDINSNLSGGATVLDIGSVYDTDTITREQIQSGYWDGAQIYSFFTDWAYPVEDEEEDRIYTFGKVRQQGDRYTVEMMSRLDLLNKEDGVIHEPKCRYVLGDENVDGNIIASDESRCKVNPLLVANIATSITSISSQMQFTCSGISGSFPDDYFGFGEIIFTSGANAGQPYKFIKASTAAGVITLAQPFYYPIELGDLLTLRPGCRKRFNEDCIGKFANGLHFGGFPHVPQRSSVAKFGNQ